MMTMVKHHQKNDGPRSCVEHPSKILPRRSPPLSNCEVFAEDFVPPKPFSIRNASGKMSLYDILQCTAGLRVLHLCQLLFCCVVQVFKVQFVSRGCQVIA